MLDIIFNLDLYGSQPLLTELETSNENAQGGSGALW
jgi:hypothetical protein